jgi:hypothetical protein
MLRLPEAHARTLERRDGALFPSATAWYQTLSRSQFLTESQVLAHLRDDAVGTEV